MRLDELVARTPPERDRVVDGVRAVAVLVVVLWHWVGSLTHRGVDGVVVMPNPIADVPGGWLATWVLQVVPAFFLVGGYANLAAWDACGRRAGVFLRRRMRRLLAPVALWVVVWLGVEVAAAVLLDGHRWLGAWFPGVLVPLWFLGVHAALTAAVPWTARLHRAARRAGVVGLLAVLVAAEILARTAVPGAVWVAAAVVWVLVHQLGYLWRDHRDRVADPRVAGALAALGLAGLVVLTTAAGYPRSMVATTGTASNLLPTNVTVLALAVLQLGLIGLAHPLATRTLARPRVWRPVVALNGVALTVFVWHMSAFAVVLLAAEHLGAAPSARPDTAWLLSRPLWLVVPGVVLLVSVAVLGGVERAAARPRAMVEGRTASGTPPP